MKTPRPIPMDRLLEHILRELEMSSTVFGVPAGYRGGGKQIPLAGGYVEATLGLKAGHHTATAQGLLCGYLAGARVLELRAKGDENTPAEYIKGYFLIQIFAKELGLGDPAGCAFPIRLESDENPENDPEIAQFLEYLSHPATHPVWEECRRAAEALLPRFNNLDREYLAQIPQKVTNWAPIPENHPAQTWLRTQGWRTDPPEIPLTLVSQELQRPGGFLRLRQLARALATGETLPQSPQTLARQGLPGPIPMLDCFAAPCKGGCPFHMDVAAALRLMGDGRCRDALRVILDRNPLPHLTSAVCPAPCQNYCTRLLYEEAVDIRGCEKLSVSKAFADLLPRLEPEEHRLGCRVAVVGGGPGGMAVSFLLARRGVSVTLFEKAPVLGGKVRNLIGSSPLTAEDIAQDAQLLELMNVDVRLGENVPEPLQLLKSGYSHLVLATGEGEGPDTLAEPRIYHLSGADLPQVIAAAHEISENILGPGEPLDRPAGRRGSAVGKKGKLVHRGEPEGECQRCLDCATVCEGCVDVCPSRANLPVFDLTRRKPVILHLDALCGHCGLCAQVCPFEGNPAEEKFTLFEEPADFEAGKNPGFVVLDFLSRRVKLRLDGRVWDMSLNRPDRTIPGEVRALMESIFIDYAYLLDKNRRMS